MAITRAVILSDDTEAIVRLRPQSVTEYYSDVPHCVRCDTTARDATLRRCLYVVRGKNTGRCGRYICLTCSSLLPNCGQHEQEAKHV
jgi:hypothetical protein